MLSAVCFQGSIKCEVAVTHSVNMSFIFYICRKDRMIRVSTSYNQVISIMERVQNVS